MCMKDKLITMWGCDMKGLYSSSGRVEGVICSSSVVEVESGLGEEEKHS